LPKTIRSAPCRTAPTIDGAVDADEWKDAAPLEFEMRMLRLKPWGFSTRVCQLRVMNSANALYLALTIPDETFNNSLTPLDLDCAILAFCREKELKPGDDRKVLAPGLYVDKHVTAPGKDADDKRQDGRGAMRRDEAGYTLEWAIPLDSGDPEDMRVKPGEALRFNLAYFDGFQADMKNTQVGTAFGTDLNRATDWGTLQLAADVQGDGGAAFKAPAWIEALFKGLRHAPASRLRLVESSLLPGVSGPVAKAVAEYTYLDPHGKPKIGKARLYLPAAVKGGKAKTPLYVCAGYEVDDGSALQQVRRGFAVVTPSALEANPLVRTSSPDVALLHIARSLPFVDDARVVIAGGSAGGYMTLLLAAETFPLAGAAPDVPPINWGYNAAFFLQRKQHAKSAAQDPKAPKLPVFEIIVPIVEQAQKVYGPSTDDPAWWRHSPLAHLATITCPVSVYWSTADMLVPIDQVGKAWVRPLDAKAYPAGFTMDPAKLTSTREGQLRLTDVLPEKDYEVFVVSEAEIQRSVAAIKSGKAAPELANSRTRPWSITILDEGRPEPQLGHTKYACPRSRNEFFTQVLTGKIPASQLTPAKLERLMDRYAGKEWLPTGLKHLDFAESERADVLRGLRTYVSAGDENAKTMADLYAKLPAARQALEREVLQQLLPKTEK